MGEYAIRKSDKVEIKLGTCESMYYIRYEDRKKVIYLPGNVNPATELNLFWRLPFTDEDKVAIGEYESGDKGIRLAKKEESGYYTNFEDPETLRDIGHFQMVHEESGLLLNVPCHHGLELPNLGDVKAHWNGKGHSFELISIKNTTNGPRYVVHCRHCHRMWSYELEDIIDYVFDERLKKRLINYKENWSNI